MVLPWVGHTSSKFWVIHILVSLAKCDIRENFDTNKYQNILVSKNLHQRMFEHIRAQNVTPMNVWINICIENCMNIQIFVSFLDSNTLTNQYPNIFVQTNLTRTNVRMYLWKKNCECPKKYLWPIYLNIWISNIVVTPCSLVFHVFSKELLTWPTSPF